MQFPSEMYLINPKQIREDKEIIRKRVYVISQVFYG